MDSFYDNDNWHIKYNKLEDCFEYKKKMKNGQTFRLDAYRNFVDDYNLNTYSTNMKTYWEICNLCVYKKRKHIEESFQKASITGVSPFETYKIGKQAIEILLEAIRDYQDGDKNYVIYAQWLDNRRRNTYEKILKRYGFKYNKLEYIGKCLYYTPK